MLQCGLLRSNFSLAIRVLPALLVPVTESLERVAGIEPASSAWKAAALPLCYTRLAKAALPHSPLLRRVVGEVGLEPTKPLQQRIYSPPPLPLGTFPQARGAASRRGTKASAATVTGLKNAPPRV